MTKPGDAAVMLARYGACRTALVWAEGKTAAEAWETCQRPEWMLWIIRKINNPSLVVPLARIVQTILADETHGVVQYAQTDAQRTAVVGVVALYQRRIDGAEPSAHEWHAAATAAYAAAAATAAYAAAAAAADAYAAAAAAADAYAADAYAADAYAAVYAAAAAYADAYAAAAATLHNAWTRTVIRQHVSLAQIIEDAGAE